MQNLTSARVPNLNRLSSPRLALLAASLALLTLGGCRFANKVEYAPPRQNVTYYESSPQRLRLCGSGDQGCVEAATNLLPEDAFNALLITDPMILFEDLQANEKFLLSSKDTSLGFKVTEGKYAFSGTTTPEAIWGVKECETYLTGEIQGSLNTNAPHSAETAGRLEMKLTVTRRFEGALCPDLLYLMYECHSDATKCPGETASDWAAYQSDVEWLFGKHLQGSAVAPGDIPDIRSISYEVFYQ